MTNSLHPSPSWDSEDVDPANKLHNDDDDSSSGHPSDTATIHAQREPFWAFVPQVGQWAAGIVAGEWGAARRGVQGLPSWSRDYVQETVDFYAEHPQTLSNEVSRI